METATPIPPTEAAADPLRDPTLMAFVYSGWALVGLIAGDLLALWALVAGTGLLGVLSARLATPRRHPEFLADFATILLCCAASLASSVLVLRLI